MSKKPTLAIDIDECLAYFIPNVADYYNDIVLGSSQGKKYTAASFYTMDFDKVFGITYEECNKMMFDFVDTDYFRVNIKPVDGAVEAMKILKNDYDLQIVTARQDRVAKLTREWVSKYFPDIFTEIHFANHYSETHRAIPKSELCKKINAVCLVDDSLRYARDCSMNNVPCIVFGDYPWNRGETPRLVERASTWEEVLAKLPELIKASQKKEIELPVGFANRGNAVAPDNISATERVGNWTQTLHAKYASHKLEQSDDTVPLGFTSNRSNTKTMEELSLERNATSVCVAEVNMGMQEKDRVLSYVSKPGESTNEELSKGIGNNSGGNSDMISMLAKVVLAMDTRLAALEAKQDRILALLEKHNSESR